MRFCKYWEGNLCKECAREVDCDDCKSKQCCMTCIKKDSCDEYKNLLEIAKAINLL